MVEITLSDGKKIEIKKIKFGVFAELQKYANDNAEITKHLISSSTGLSAEDINNLEVEDGLELIKKIMELNPFFQKAKDFTKPKPSEESG